MSVAPHKMFAGVDAPGVPWSKHDPAKHGHPTYDWRHQPATAADLRRAAATPDAPTHPNTRGVEAVYDVVPLEDALGRRYRTDAHLVTYVIEPRLERQPRMKKGGLPWLRSQGFDVQLGVLFADIDNPDHNFWTPELREVFDRQREALSVLQTVGIYFTARGYRLVQPLEEPVGPDQAEALWLGWHQELVAGGLNADNSCKDWTRHFRLPHVQRDGHMFTSPLVDLALMRPRADIPSVARAPAARKPRTPRAEQPVRIASVKPGPLAAALRGISAGGRPSRHDVSLALAGELLHRGAAPDLVPGIVHGAAVSAGWHADRLPQIRQNAEDTVRRWSIDRPVRRVLPPAITAALDAAFGAAPLEPAELAERMRATLWDAPDGTTLLKVPCGSGKTRTAEDVAAARAAAGLKTAISVPTNELALQVTAHLREKGVGVCRVFGPAGAKDAATGKPICAYTRSAEVLARARYSVRRLLCDGDDLKPCEYRDACPAYGGYEGELDALVAVGPHALVHDLGDHAGTRGLLVVDEPSECFDENTLDANKIRSAMAALQSGMFRVEVREQLELGLQATLSWLERAPLEERASLAEQAPDAAEAASAADWLAPPISGIRELLHIRRYPNDAAAVKAAAEVLGAVRRALADEDVEVIVYGDDPRRMVVFGWERRMYRALRRDGPNVIMAADVDVYVDHYRRVLGYEPRSVTLGASDGAPVRRVLIEARGTRSRWVNDCKPPHKLLEQALAIARAAGPKVAVVTFQALVPWVRSVAPDVDTRHYGGLRGLDHWKHHDALVTLGDNRKNLHAMARRALDVDLEARADAEQCHGRLRVIHRDTPCTQVHVGQLVPRGWLSWERVEAETGPPSRARTLGDGALRATVEAAGGVVRVAEQLGCARRTVSRWLAGEGAPTPEQLATLVCGGAMGQQRLDSGVAPCHMGQQRLAEDPLSNRCRPIRGSEAGNAPDDDQAERLAINGGGW